MFLESAVICGCGQPYLYIIYIVCYVATVDAGVVVLQRRPL